MDLRERPSSVTIRHPWETVRARFFCRVLANPVVDAVRVLDIGAGDGFVASQMLAALPGGSTVTCVDSEYSDQHLAELRASSPRGLGFARTAPAQAFDVIVMLDVLEHIADDRGFLRDFVMPRLRPDGLVLVSVPAYQALYTQHDVVLGHHRRYSGSQLRAALESAGLRIRIDGSLFGSLLLPRALGKALERARGVRSEPSMNGLADQISTGISHWSHGRVVTTAIQTALELDARACELAARLSAPSAGLSVWALCERG
jgi:SAM-dependent methyltransferase